MFPTPFAKLGPRARTMYRLAVPASLLVWLLPLFAIALTSTRSLDDLSRGNYWGWPTHLRIVQNYTAVFTSSPMGRYLINSVVITLPAVAGTLAVSMLAGYALARYRFRGNLALFATFIAGNFVPFQVLMIPVRNLMIHVVPLYDTVWALVLFHIAFQTGCCTLFIRNFVRERPDALVESARIEGVSEVRILRHVILPLMRPALAALAVLEFTFIWNDYFWALVLVQSDTARPVTAGLQALAGMWLASWQLMSAGALIAAAPSVAIFFVLQRHFIAGLTLGAVKE